MLKTEPITLAANQERPVYLSGRSIAVLSCTVASFEMAFDNDPYTTVYAGAVYPSPKEFSQIRVRDSLGAGCDIVLTAADELGMDVAAQASAAVFAAMQALLTTIDADTSNLPTMAADLALTTPPSNQSTIVPAAISVTGTVPADTILAARAGRKSLWFETPATNAGDVYIGFANTVTAANYARRMPPNAVWWPVWTGAIYAVSENGSEVLHGYEMW